ncbi:MAG: hypothetical protein JWO36_3094 [Myxococcales bacterium]|nr:hypothetical protein [Myxococcales bacterium]
MDAGEAAPVANSSAFAKGLASGIAISALLVQLWLGVEMQGMRGMYKDFGGAPLPVLTRVVISPGWLLGVPALASLAIVFLIRKRPRPLNLYVGLAALLVATAVGTYWFAQAPLRELAGNISS